MVYYYYYYTVFVIFSFLRMDNYLVCAPPHSGIPPPQLCAYFGAYLKNYLHNFAETLECCSKQHKSNKFALPKKHDLLPLAGG